MPRLVVTTKGLAALSHDLGDTWVTIGRAYGNTFQIVEPSVSGRHCEVRLQGDELVVRDLQSTNGTFVAGKKISEGVLKLGQTLRLGEVELCFEAAGPSGKSFVNKMLLKNTASAAPPKEKPVQASPDTGSGPAKEFHVLFVDDSMAFLDLFNETCTMLSGGTWGIRLATTADTALAILREEPIDLAVLDIGMPIVDGLQLLGIIKRRHPGVKIAVVTGLSTSDKRAACLSSGAELFIEKPLSAGDMKVVFNMLNELLSWSRREGFSGALPQVRLMELVQMECIGCRSSILEVHNPETSGQIYIEAGSIIHAAAGTLVGEKAFHRLLSLKGGDFQLKPFQAPSQRTLHGGWEMLLMEAARLSDEETAFITNLPESHQPSAIHAPAEPPVTATELPPRTPPKAAEGQYTAQGDSIVQKK